MFQYQTQNVCPESADSVLTGHVSHWKEKEQYILYSSFKHFLARVIRIIGA